MERRIFQGTDVASILTEVSNALLIENTPRLDQFLTETQQELGRPLMPDEVKRFAYRAAVGDVVIAILSGELNLGVGSVIKP